MQELPVVPIPSTSQKPSCSSSSSSIHHLDPDTSIIAVIGGGISGLSTVLQILVDQEKSTQQQEPPQDEDELHQEETSDEMGTNRNHHLKPISTKNKKKIHYGRICRTIQIYEKHPDPSQHGHQHRNQPRMMGYGLTITYQPDGNLSKSMGNGILDDITDYDCPSRSHYILNQNGTILGYYGNAYHSAGHQGYGQRGNIRIPRQVLCQLLLQKIQSFATKNGTDEKTMYPNIEIFYNHTLRTIQEEDDNGVTTTANKVKLIFDTDMNQNDTTSATTAIVDLVIAADGIHSTVVREWLQHPTPTQLPPSIPSVSKQTTSSIPQPFTNNQHPQHRQILLPPPRSLNVRIILGITDDLRNIVTAPSTYRNTTNGGGLMHHELIRECGFYTLSNGHRLFVMPYTGSTLNRSYDPQEPVRFMWQLSFLADTSHGGDDRADGSNHSVRYTSSELHNEALQRTTNWHEPVTTLIYHTSTSNVWGTMLRDRNPSDIGKMLLVQKQKPNLSAQREPQYQNLKAQRVIVIGDAMHGMSPFKGQGANQCFKDAICVSKWLYKLGSRNLTTAIQFMTREIIQRTEPIVLASRQAAEYWHTMNVNRINSNDDDNNDDVHRNDFTFAGINDGDDIHFKHQLLIELQSRNINAGTTQHLDETIRAVITELAPQIGKRQPQLDSSSTNYDVNDSSLISDQSSTDSAGSCIRSESGKQDAKQRSDQGKGQISALATIIDMANSGNTGGLRKVSWYQPNYLRQLKIYYADCSSGISGSHHHPILWNEMLEYTEYSPSNMNWTTILHVAIIGGHPRTIHWLITEAGCTLNDKDSCARTAFDIFNQCEITQHWCTDKRRFQIRELLMRLQRTCL